MTYKEYNIMDRVTTEELPYPVTDTLYVKSLLDVVEFLIYELKMQLDREDRFRGVMVSYYEKIDHCFNDIFKGDKEEDLDFYGRTLYALKIVLRKEHARLVRKKLSPADASICLIHRLLTVIKDILPSEFVNVREVYNISDIIEKVWENIRNYTKKDSLFALSNLIRECQSRKLVGKYSTDVFHIEEKIRKVQILEGDGTRLCIDNDKLKEINL